MKLKAAKCPSCGANLKLNPNDEYAECEFCHTNILIEDAVAKYKLELSGNVKVSGIKDNEDRLSDAKKYFKLNEYENCQTVLNVIINNEPFNVDAYILKLKCFIKQFNEIYSDENYETDCDLNPRFWKDFDLIMSTFDRLVAIDEKEKYTTKLSDEKETLEKMIDADDRLADDLELCGKIDEIINEITSYKFNSKISSAIKHDYKNINKVIIAYFKELLGCEVLKVPDKVRCVYRDLTIKFYDANSNFKEYQITKYKSLKELYDALDNSKDDIITKIEKTATSANPIGKIKNIFKR